MDRDYTVARWLSTWLTLRSPALADRTVADYQGYITNHLAPALGHIPLTDLAPIDIDLTISRIAADHPRTAQLAYTVLSAAMRRAVDLELLIRNPCAAVPKPIVRARSARYWPSDTARRYLDAATTDRLYALWAVALSCGLRRGELLGLRWSDVHLSSPGGVLRVRQQLIDISGNIILAPPKSDAGVRDIPISPSVVRILIDHRRAQLADKLAAGKSWQSSPIAIDLVFRRPDGLPIYPRALARYHRRQCAAADVPYINLHGLRHTMATIAIANGTPLTVLQHILGHSSIQVTSDIYGHVVDASRVSAVQSVSNTLFTRLP